MLKIPKNFILILKFISFISCLPSQFDQKIDELKDVSHKLRVIHYDCSQMKENKMYSLNQVAPCSISPENIDMRNVRVTIYQRSYRTFVKAVMCSVSVNVLKYHCGMFSHSSIVHDAPLITYHLIVSPEQCKQANRTGKLTVNDFQDKFDIEIELNNRKISYKNYGADLEDDSSTACDDSGDISHYSFETLMQEISLEVNVQDKSVYNTQGQKLPCALHEGGCDSTSLDPFAYSWDIPENCLVFKKFTQDAKMIKYDIEAGNPKYFIVSDEKSEVPYTGPGTHKPAQMDIKLRVLDQSETLCGKPEPLYKTNLESLFVSYSGGFSMRTGKPNDLKSEHSYHKVTVASGTELSWNGYTRKVKDDPHHSPSRTPWAHVGEDELDYEVHLAAKLDYIIYHNYLRIKQSWHNVIMNQCELDRTQKQTILMLALQNNRLAGYMLTGNRSMFLDTDGSIGWLYHCPKKNSPLKVLERCYDRIPIHYNDRTKFVDPITRQTFPFANEVKCVGGYKNAYQLDLDNEKSWYHLMPAPVPFKTPFLFSPLSIGHIINSVGYESQRAGIYTPNQLKDFWDNILHSSASKSVLQKISHEVLSSREIDYSEKDIYSSAMGINRQIYLDSLLSPNYFVTQFTGTFGIITYYLEKLGIYFAVFLCIKFILDVITTMLRAFEIHKMSNRTIGFWKILLGATYNLFVLSVFTSIFSEGKPTPSAPSRQRRVSSNYNIDEENYHEYSSTQQNYALIETKIDENKKLYPPVPQITGNVIAPP